MLDDLFTHTLALGQIPLCLPDLFLEKHNGGSTMLDCLSPLSLSQVSPDARLNLAGLGLLRILGTLFLSLYYEATYHGFSPSFSQQLKCWVLQNDKMCRVCCVSLNVKPNIPGANMNMKRNHSLLRLLSVWLFSISLSTLIPPPPSLPFSSLSHTPAKTCLPHHFFVGVQSSISEAK